MKKAICEIDKIINYYDNNSDKYISLTKDLSFIEIIERFLSHLNNKGYILDFGCGSARDSKCFLDKGYKVLALDGSSEMCEFAKALIGKENVLNMQFNDFIMPSTFDGIYACASLVHLDDNLLIQVLSNLYESLKNDGRMYASFKYGVNERISSDSRYYNDMSEEKFNSIIENIFEIIDIWYTGSFINNGEEWINFILKKKL